MASLGYRRNVSVTPALRCTCSFRLFVVTTAGRWRKTKSVPILTYDDQYSANASSGKQ
jgi:hypothetical protein